MPRVRRFAPAPGRRLPSFVGLQTGNVDAFDLDVFGRVGDDYEAIHTIRGDLERDLGRPVPSEEVGAALLRLAAQGLVDAFEFDW